MKTTSRSVRRLRRSLNPIRLGGAIFILLVMVLTLLVPILAIPDPLTQDIANRLQPIGYPGHLLGTDRFGRDMLSRLLFGARVELVVALGATAVALVIGVTLGMLGGFLGALTETLTMRTVDVILAFPPIVLALLIVTIYGPGVSTLIITMGILFSPRFARLTYGQVVTVKHLEYVEAARVFGNSPLRTMLTVVLPNVSAPIIVQLPLTLATSILLESGLSYLGLGVVPPTPSWGLMVADGQRDMIANASLVALPSAVIVATILAFGLLGDILRDWLDPRRGMASNL